MLLSNKSFPVAIMVVRQICDFGITANESIMCGKIMEAAMLETWNSGYLHKMIRGRSTLISAPLCEHD